MGQPVRNSIQESHPELGVKTENVLLVDGGNLLRISFADTKVNSDGVHYGGVFQFLLQVRMMLKKYKFDKVYVVFDDEDSGILRYELYHEYKANRDKKYAEHSNMSAYGAAVEAKLKKWRQNHMEPTVKVSKKDVEDVNFKKRTDYDKFIDENFARERKILLGYFDELFIRWIFNDKTEGDDLIAYYVKNKKANEKILIMSGDQDITQLIRDGVGVYNPNKKKIYSKANFQLEMGYPVENVVVKKIFCGDSSDNIGNIKGLSDARLVELMPEFKTRPITVDEVIGRAQEMIDERIKAKKKPLAWHENIVHGVSNKEYDGDFYEINRRIIDLSDPLLTDDAEKELREMMDSPINPDGRSFSNLYSYIMEDGIDELKDSNKFGTFFEPFKYTINKEIEYFKKNIEKK